MVSNFKKTENPDVIFRKITIVTLAAIPQKNYPSRPWQQFQYFLVAGRFAVDIGCKYSTKHLKSLLLLLRLKFLTFPAAVALFWGRAEICREVIFPMANGTAASFHRGPPPLLKTPELQSTPSAMLVSAPSCRSIEICCEQSCKARGSCEWLLDYVCRYGRCTSGWRVR